MIPLEALFSLDTFVLLFVAFIAGLFVHYFRYCIARRSPPGTIKSENIFKDKRVFIIFPLFGTFFVLINILTGECVSPFTSFHLGATSPFVLLVISGINPFEQSEKIG